MCQDRHATPLELFIDFLQCQTELSPLTETGTTAFRRQVRAALEYLPGIVLTGEWHDSSGDAVAEATRAIVSTFGPAETPDDTAAHELEATYVLGLVVGLALAHTLSGVHRPASTDPRHPITSGQA